MSFLTPLPTALIIFLVAGVFVAASVAGLLVVRRLVPLPVLREHNDVAGFIFAALGVIYAVILAFLVIAVWESYEDDRRNVDAEAAAAVTVDRQARAFPVAEQTAVHDSIEAYVGSIIEDEWPAMRESLPSPATEAALERLWASVLAIRPADERERAWYDATITSLDDLTSLRQIRLSEAEQRLPDVMNLLLILGAVITIAYTYLYGVRNTYGQVAMTAALALTIGLVVSLIIILDAPFHGDTAISPEPFVEALVYVEANPADRG